MTNGQVETVKCGDFVANSISTKIIPEKHRVIIHTFEERSLSSCLVTERQNKKIRVRKRPL